MQLAIDTSTDTASLALADDCRILAELTWRCGQNHTTTLLPNLNDLLRQAGIELKAITGIIVARGPGSYNGLRVGISAAKGLAFSLNVPLTGISTLEAMAYQHAATGLPVCPILKAGRTEIAAARYQMIQGQWQELTSAHITTVEALCAGIDTRTIFCGEITANARQTLSDALKEMAVIPSDSANLRRAGFLVELGKIKIDAGKCDTPTTLSPIYLRRPHITKPNKDKNIAWGKYGN